MKRRFIYLFCYLLVCFWSLSISAQQGLAKKVHKLLSDTLFDRSEVGISVYDLTAQKLIFTYQEKQLYRPASVQKTLTCIEAIRQLGKSHPFTTQLFYTGKIKKQVLKGDLYVVGDLDPLFNEENMDSLVEQVARTGIKEIRGELIGDVSLMDSIYWGSGWRWDDVEEGFQPYISPLMYHGGQVKLTLLPVKQKGKQANVTAEPSSRFYNISNNTYSYDSSAGKFKATRNWLERKNNLMLSGNVSRKRVVFQNLYTGKDFFMYAFIEHLQKRGIRCSSKYRYAPLSHFSSVQIAKTSHSLEEVVYQALKESDNLCAEAVLVHLSKKTTEKKHLSIGEGVTELYHRVHELGFTKQDCHFVDGCGLSNYNYVSPQVVMAFLRYAYRDTKVFNTIYKSMPIAGIDGTLKYRMRKGKAYCNVHAKTGTMTGVSSLAGYLRAANGHMIAFVILNQNQLSAKPARRFQDKLCELLAKYRGQ